jgi:DNA helicase II / ATP-dependent DNA helicase PcrA
VDPDALLDGLDDAQRDAVTSPGRPLVILAPAGSGKTRVLTRRIAHRVATGDADPRRALALTFTRKAAGELRDRLQRLGLRTDVTAGTFHAVAWAQLRTRWQDQRRTPPSLLDRKGRLLAELVPSGGRRDARTAVTELANEIDWAKARMIAPADYPDAARAAGRRCSLGPDVVADRYAAYEQRKREAGLVDFDDLLGLCVSALERDEQFAAAQRWRFRHLFVDELQDVNPLQFRLLEAWRGTSDDVCAVGDPQQAIYGWNGADARFLLDIEQWWPSAEVVLLRTSYRSTPQILDAAASVLRHARQPAHTVRAVRPEGPAVRVTAHESDRAEAIAISQAVRRAHEPGRPWREQAVLVRTHAQTALLAEAMREAGIPHRVRGAGALLDRPELRRGLRAIRDAGVPLGTALVDLEATADAELQAAVERADEMDQESGTALVEQAAEARGVVAVLTDLGRDYLRLDPTGSAAGFAGWLTATVRREGADEGGDSVEIATFHAAKGLEWAVVHLAGIEHGFVPISHARTAAAKAEEARLLYVAMTRAQRELRISWARERTFASKVVERRRSSLLDPVIERQQAEPPPDEAAPRPAAEAAPDWRQRLAEQREVLARRRAEPEAEVPVELAELRAWRDRAARAARVDPDAVLTDRALERIVDLAPADVAALGDIRGVGPVLANRFGDELLAIVHGTSAAS